MAPRQLPEDRASCSQNRRTLPLLGHWAGEWPRSQQKYALDQLASGTSGRLQGGRVSSDVHVLRLGLGTGSRQHLATPQNICEESRSTRTTPDQRIVTIFGQQKKRTRVTLLAGRQPIPASDCLLRR